MNKKIVSFVLAMVLSAGLGVSSLFAYEYTGGTKSGGGSFTINPQDLAGLAGNIDKYTGDEAGIKGAETTTTRICAVFNYTAGIVTTAIDADRNITIYDQGRYRATLGYNDDGTYTITNFAVYGTDWDIIAGFEGATDGEKLKNFLLYMGVSESALQCYEKKKDEKTGEEYFVGENGERLTEQDIADGKAGKKVDVAWLEQAAAQLKKGINHSITINFTAQYGASVTYNVNGKQLETIAYDGEAIQTYHYNAAGTLETITQKTIEADTSDASDVETTTTTSDRTVSVDTTSDGIQRDKDGNQVKDGMTIYTIDKGAAVKVSSTKVGKETTTTADVQVSYEDSAGEKHVKDITLSDVEFVKKDGKTYLKGKYNGQIFEFRVSGASNKETKKGDTTKRQNSVKMKSTFNTIHCDEWGRQSYVTNSDGKITARYSYSSNGSVTSTWDAATNSMTYYTGGKAAFVMNDSGFITTRYFYHENGSLDGVMTYNYDADKTDGNNVVATSMTAYRWGNVVGSANLADVEDNQPKTFDELRAAIDYIKANPGAAIDSLREGADLKNVMKGLTDDEKKMFNTKFDDVNDEDGEYNDDYRKTYNKVVSKNKSTFGNITSIALYESDLKNTALMNAFGINANDMANMLAASNGYSAVGNMALTIDVLDFDTDTINTGTVTEKVTKNTEKGDSSNRKGAYLRSSTNSTSEITQNGIVGQQLKVTLTVMDHGGQKYQANCSPITLRDSVNQVITNGTTITDQYSADPVVTGTAVTDPAELQEIAKGLAVEEGSTATVGDDGVITIKDKDGNVTATVTIDNEGVINVTDAEGNTKRYVAVKDAKINMLDGSGVLDMAEGEAMLIDIGDMDASTIKNGDNVMFMGDVGYTATGSLAVTMRTDYGGGFKNFGADASAMGDAMARIAYVSDHHEAATADEQWIVTNSNINSEALKDFSNAMSKKNGEPVTLKELEKAWEDLLNATAPIF